MFNVKYFKYLKILFPSFKLCWYVMSPDEQKAFDDTKAELEALKKEKEEAGKNKSTPPAKENDDPEAQETLKEQAKKNADQKAKIDAENIKIERAIKFDYEIKNLLKDDIEIIGEEIKNIVEIADKRTYTNSVEKANEVRATVLDAFFKQQKNIDALVTEGFKAKATSFLALAQVKKYELADEYWELFELAIANIKGIAKQEELKKQSKGENTDKVVDEHNQKFFNSRSHYIKERK